MEKRQRNYVIVLGCGESILNLTEEEKKFINSCKYVIGVNKFMAFYKQMCSFLLKRIRRKMNSSKFLGNVNSYV